MSGEMVDDAALVTCGPCSARLPRTEAWEACAPHLRELSPPPDAPREIPRVEAPVVKLVTLPERDAADQRDYEARAEASALATLEEQVVRVKERGEADRCVGVAIALTFADGSYGYVSSERMDRVPGLLAALDTLKLKIIEAG